MRLKALHNYRRWLKDPSVVMEGNPFPENARDDLLIEFAKAALPACLGGFAHVARQTGARAIEAKQVAETVFEFAEEMLAEYERRVREEKS